MDKIEVDRVPPTEEAISKEQGAEEHDLGDQETPHADRVALVLLLDVLELVPQRAMLMRVFLFLEFVRDGCHKLNPARDPPLRYCLPDSRRRHQLRSALRRSWK